MYGKSLQILPMKSAKLPKGKEYMKDEICNSGEYFGQLKKDGYWYVYEKDSDGESFLFSRVVGVNGYLAEKSANVPHIINFLSQRVPNGTIIIGEIYYPNKTSKDVTSIMGCLSDKAIERQNGEHGLIHFYMHDILMWAKVNYVENKYSNFKRYTKLEEKVYEFNLIEESFMEFADGVFVDLNDAVDASFENGEEGMILKKKTGLYCPDKKPAWNWIKFKIEDEHDVICMGYELPKVDYEGTELETWKYFIDGKPVTKSHYNGWIGALNIGVYKDGELVSIGTVSSGITDELCEEIKVNPNKYIGKPLAVKCMMVGDAALRHPAIDRWRLDDINPSECTWEKIFK
jgi:ATP-dependent DNA ligase